jgi:N-acetylmuramate 1-kinase
MPSPNTFPPRLVEALPALLSLAGSGPEGIVTKLKGDASTREYYRVAVAGRSFVAMVLPGEDKGFKADEIGQAGEVKELPFADVHAFLRERGVRVPEIFGYDRERGVLLLEDFGDRLLGRAAADAATDGVRRLYLAALDELERIAPLPDRPSACILFSRRFDRELYDHEFLHFVEYGLDKRLKRPPVGTERERIVRGLTGLTDEYLSWGDVVCHRDYHSRNLMVLADSSKALRLGVLDFQDALLAPLFYDLASLLRDSYVTLDPALQDGLVEEYRARMKKYRHRHTESREAFRRAFDLMGLHRNLKAAGRFCYFHHVKGNPDYLPSVPRSLDYVRKTLADYGELRPLRETLLPYFDEIRETCPR